MAEKTVSFKTAFKKNLESPSDSKSLSPKEHKSNALSGVISAVPKRNTKNNEKPCSDNASEIIAQKAKAEAKVNDLYNRCQSNEESFEKRSNKTKSNVSRGYSGSNLNQNGKLEWNEVFKEILGNKPDLKTEEPKGIDFSFEKDGPDLQKSFVSKEQERGSAKKKETNHEYDSENMSDNTLEMIDKHHEEQKKKQKEQAREKFHNEQQKKKKMEQQASNKVSNEMIKTMVNAEEMELCEMFNFRRSYSIHSSGDVYSAEDAKLEVKIKEIKSLLWKHDIIHPIINQPLPSLPVADFPRSRSPPPPPPPPPNSPVPFDEQAEDDDFYSF